MTRALAWYTTCRPHTAVGTATPRETPFVVAYVDPDHTLPVLLRRAA